MMVHGVHRVAGITFQPPHYLSSCELNVQRQAVVKASRTSSHPKHLWTNILDRLPHVVRNQVDRLMPSKKASVEAKQMRNREIAALLHDPFTRDTNPLAFCGSCSLHSDAYDCWSDMLKQSGAWTYDSESDVYVKTSPCSIMWQQVPLERITFQPLVFLEIARYLLDRGVLVCGPRGDASLLAATNPDGTTYRCVARPSQVCCSAPLSKMEAFMWHGQFLGTNSI